MPTKPRVGYVTPGRWGDHPPAEGGPTPPWSDQPFQGGVQIRSRGSQPDLSPIPDGVIPAAGITTTSDLDGTAPSKPSYCSGCRAQLGAIVVGGPAGQMFCPDCRPGQSFVRLTPGRRPKSKQRGSG